MTDEDLYDLEDRDDAAISSAWSTLEGAAIVPPSEPAMLPVSDPMPLAAVSVATKESVAPIEQPILEAHVETPLIAPVAAPAACRS